jgi:hypothetical protein
MKRLTLKSSTIFIAKGSKTRVYRSLDEIPPKLRQQLDASTNGFNSATILIADRRGRDEILRALNRLPSSLRGRLAQSLSAVRSADPSPQADVPEPRVSRLASFVRQNWLEVVLPGAVGLIIWAAFHFR